MPDHNLFMNTPAEAPTSHYQGPVIRSINVVEVIDEAKIGRTQILVLFVCSLVAIFDGFDLQAIAFTGPVIAQQLRIEATALGFIFSAALMGMTVGALLAGLLGDQHPAVGQERDAPREVERRHLRQRERQGRLRRLCARIDLRICAC
jgi:MFS family permease